MPAGPVEHPAEALRRLTGNTPLLGIHFRHRGTTRSIYAKSEQLNMTGSIKDRMALPS
jgi:cysteine synthase